MKRSVFITFVTTLFLLAFSCLSCSHKTELVRESEHQKAGSAGHRYAFGNTQETQNTQELPAKEQISKTTDEKKDRGSYWVKEYGALSKKDHPLVSRVQNVFAKVLAAADKQANRFPKLIILEELGDPWVICLRDGSVILTQKAMEICYRGVDYKTGDARVAFVLGHELAHLALDDYWHSEALEAIEMFGPVPEKIRQWFKERNSLDRIKEKEVKADSYGILYSSMAGYDPKRIVDNNGTNFFQEWVNQITGEVAYDHHLPPKERAALLLSKMKTVVSKVNQFDFGVRLCQLARYKDALDLLEEFRKAFPCREVFNNIGLIHFQMAMEILDELDWNAAYEYNLSTVIDTETLATMMDTETRGRRLRGGIQPGETYLENEQFKERMKEAIRHLKMACEKDTAYIPARVNLSSAYIMLKEYSAAMKILDEVKKLGNETPEVLNNRAIAMYLLGPSIGVDMFHQAYTMLKKLVGEYPKFPDPQYNLGRILSEEKRNSAAREAWKRYLRLEPMGVYAEMAREALGREPESSNDRVSCRDDVYGPTPVGLGNINGIDEKSEEALNRLSIHELELGRIFGDIYIGEDLRVLVLDDVIEVVEDLMKEPKYLSQVSPKCGPYRTFDSPSGIKTLVYEAFAVDVRNDLILKVIYFSKGKN